MLDDLRRIPPESLARRALLSVLLAAGLAMTASGSIFIRNTPAIPYGFIPDLRFALLLGMGLALGAYAAGGAVHRRRSALWPTILVIVGFHLEEATVHWIGPYPGSITGSRIGLLGTSGSLLALAALTLLHIETEAHRLARDLESRGTPAMQAHEAARALRGAGTRRVLALAAGVAGLGSVVAAAEGIFGNDAQGGDLVLVLGGILLLALGVVLSRLAPKPEAGEA